MSTPHVTTAELQPFDTNSTDLNAAMKYLHGLYLATGGEPDATYMERKGKEAMSRTFESYPHTTYLRTQVVNGRVVMYYQKYIHMEGCEVDLTGNPLYDVQLIELAQQAHALRVMYHRSQSACQ